jgi:hypothetical protein
MPMPCEHPRSLQQTRRASLQRDDAGRRAVIPRRTEERCEKCPGDRT